jgi:hypothetical protein
MPCLKDSLDFPRDADIVDCVAASASDVQANLARPGSL